jgi:hypothetical protein
LLTVLLKLESGKMQLYINRMVVTVVAVVVVLVMVVDRKE